MSFVFLNEYLDRTRPWSPDVHRTHPSNYHGHTVYLDAMENYSLFLLAAAAVGCFLGVVFIRIKRLRKARVD